MFIEPSDLEPFAEIAAAKAQAMIDDAESMAVLAAPCIADAGFLATPELVGAVRAILRGAIIRWHDTGSGALTQVGAGSFQQSVDTRQPRRGMFWPSEISQLRDLCSKYSETGTDKAYTVSMIQSESLTGLESRPDLWFQWAHPTPPGAP